MTFWTPDDVALLRDAYTSPIVRLDELAARLGRHKTNVSRKARSLGLTNAKRDKVPRDERGLRPCDVKALPRFATDEERREHKSRTQRQHIRDHGHPRGALGMTHSAETRERLGAISRERWAQLTPEQIEARTVKRRATNMDRYGTANPAILMQEEPYSRSCGGKREDMGGRYFRSMWEANYARLLDWFKEQGEILEWEHEPETFRFEGVTRGPYTYLPDFRVTERDGSITYHEVKGWMDGPSKSRLKRMAKFYPEVKIIVIGAEEYRAFKKWAGLIPNWESGRCRRKDKEDG